MKDNWTQFLRNLINEELNEMARISEKVKIGNKNKVEKIKNLYKDAQAFKWVADMIDVIEEAGDDGISRLDVLDLLYKNYKHNKTQQEVSPKFMQFVKAGVLDLAGPSVPKREPTTKSDVRGRPVSEKTLVAKQVDQKLQADNNYQPNEEELNVLGAEFIEKLRARVMGTLKRGRPSDATKVKDGMIKTMKDLMNMGDENSDNIFDDEDLESEDFLQENKINNKMKKQSINEEFYRMQKLAGLLKESQLNEVSQNLKVSFGPFKNVEYYEVGSDELYLIVTNSDNFGEIENSIDFGDRDYMTDKEILFLNGKIEDLADKMSEYLTSIGIENEIYDNPIGYGQEIDNLVVSINSNDLSKLK